MDKEDYIYIVEFYSAIKRTKRMSFVAILMDLQISMIFPGGSGGNKLAYSAGDLGSISGLGRSHGEGNGKPPCILA